MGWRSNGRKWNGAGMGGNGLWGGAVMGGNGVGDGAGMGMVREWVEMVCGVAQ